ncbi:MAG: hypothetical protein PHI40_06070 [Caldisericia bacterium]|nr:hypothetical protein [Caldisericia bacterium]MDD4614953.1 hypothetical protein [Caldisericia bacterium]
MKRIVSICAILAMVFTVIGCSGETKEPTSNNQDVAIEMNRFDGEFVSLDYSDSWIVSEDATYQMVNLEKKGSSFYILMKLEKESFKDAETAVSDFAQTYGGTPAELITYGDNNYYQTSFEYGGFEQTMLVNMKDENKLTITLQGNGHADDESMKEILNSIVLNY